MTLIERLKSAFFPYSGAEGGDSASGTPPSPEEWAVPGEPPTWESFFDPKLMQQWAKELRDAVTAKDEAAWRLTGTSLLLQCEDEAEASRRLHRAASEAGFSFLRVPADEVESLAEGLRDRFFSCAPALVMLDFGDWAQGRIGEFDTTEPGPLNSKFAKALRKRLRRFDIEHPVVFALCQPDPDSVSEELQHIGGFDRVFVIEAPNPEFLGRRFLNQLGVEVAAEALRLVPAKVGLMLQSEFAEVDVQDLAALNLQRLAKREGRTIDFNDLANLAIRGRSEQSSKVIKGSNEQTRRKTAFHEAGHACIAVIASGGANIPDYASIVPTKAFEGIVLESLSFYDQQDEFTFQNMLLKTRIWLAGRAAEDLFFGPVNVSSGANSDLAAATRMCFRLFAYSGFSLGMENGQGSAANLAVLERGEVDPMQNDRISRNVRQFLAEQYDHVLRTLENHRPYVEAVAERLLWDPVIDQSEMIELARGHGLLLSA